MSSWILLLSSSRMLLSWHSGSHISGSSVSGRCQIDVSRWSLKVSRVCDAEPMCGLYWHWQSPAIFLRSIESKTPGPAYQGKRINILTHGGAGAGEVKCERKEGRNGKSVCLTGRLATFRQKCPLTSFRCKTRINLYSYNFSIEQVVTYFKAKSFIQCSIEIT